MDQDDLLDRHRQTLEGLLNRIDRIPRDGRGGEHRRLLGAQSEALGFAIRMIQDELSHNATNTRDDQWG